MPRYKDVYVPLEKQAEFEAWLGQNKGTFEKKLPHQNDLREEAQTQWSIQVSQAREAIRNFVNTPEDPVLAQKIRLGIFMLIGDAFSRVFPSASEKQIDWTSVQQRLIKIFDDSLPETIPENVYFLPTHKDQPFVRRSYHAGSTLLPRRITFLAERYGLSDGIIKYGTEIAEKYATKKQTISNQINEGLHNLRRDSVLKQLCLQEA